jgi:broad specificity phosphatase PhoE
MAAAGAMMSSDVPLSAQGEQRAQKLARLLADKGIAYIFSTPTIRTQATAGPLSQRLGVPVERYHPKDTLAQFLARIRSLSKGNVLLVGHSNTVDDLVNGLTGRQWLQDLPETEYDNLFLLQKRGATYRFRRQKF